MAKKKKKKGEGTEAPEETPETPGSDVAAPYAETYAEGDEAEVDVEEEKKPEIYEGQFNKNNKHEVRQLPVLISDDRALQINKESGRLFHAIEMNTDEKDSAVKEFNETINSFKKELAEYLKIAYMQAENEDVTVEFVPDRGTNIMRVVRTDTREILFEREMDIMERQDQIPTDPDDDDCPI